MTEGIYPLLRYIRWQSLMAVFGMKRAIYASPFWNAVGGLCECDPIRQKHILNPKFP